MLVKLDRLGFRGIIRDLFDSYLSDRRMYVEINGCKSETKTLNIGLPQGQARIQGGHLGHVPPPPWAQCPMEKSTKIKRHIRYYQWINQEIFKSAAAQLDNLY